ncbi:MAG TPA: hypothetical protein VHT00_14305 [Stellaceae bacterium]|jgi:hypothetical protein|nr:hypothetical protein [Stellaceae bacterium]
MSDDPWAEFDPQPVQAAPPASAQPGVFTSGAAADPFAEFNPQTISPSRALFERTAPPAPSSLVTGGPAVPDKYQQAAIDERDRLLKTGDAPLTEGYTRRLVRGATLGWGDTAAAAALTPFEMLRQGTLNPAEGYRYNRAREQLASAGAVENTGTLGDVAETVGALAGVRGGFGGSLAARLGGAGTGVTPALARIAGYGAEGATLGAIQGAGNAPTASQMGERALVGGVLGGAFGAPFGAVANVTPRSSAVVPTSDELRTLGARDYRARDRLPVSYDTGYVVDHLDNMANANWSKYGRDAPRTIDKLGSLADEGRTDIANVNALNAAGPTPGSVTAPGQVSGAPNSWQAVMRPREIASLRGELYEAGAAGKPTDERAGTIAGKQVERILTRPDPASLASGTTARDAAAAALLHQRGKGNFGAAYRSDTITNQVDKTLNDAAATHSGLNFENRLRQNLQAASRRDEFGGFTPPEQAGVEGLIRGSARANNLRELGNMLGGGGGLGRAVVMGGGGVAGGALGTYLYGGDPWAGAAGGLALGLTGRALRTAGNRAAQAGAERFAEQLRTRSPEYASRAAMAPMVPGPGAGLGGDVARNALNLGAGGAMRDAVANALLYNTTGNRLYQEQQ